VRNIINFLLNYNAFLVFIGLEVFCFYLILQNNNYQKAGFINSSNVLVGKFYASYNDLTAYLHLKQENEKLAEENARLRGQIRSAFTDPVDTAHIINDRAHQQIYRYIPARVISITTGELNNYITINKGAADGIRNRMAVICPDGVVGKVTNVSEHFASIMSLLHKNSSISARVNGNLGSLVWKGDDPSVCNLEGVSKQFNIRVGDRVYSSGKASFPEDISIGTVVRVNPGNDNNYVIRVKLSTNFNALQYVYVVDYLRRDEEQNLEEQNGNAQ